jgi:hypothetical protein
MKAPLLNPGPSVDFAFPLNVNDGSSVSVVSSSTPRSKYVASVLQGGNSLMSDVIDCTVTKYQGSNSAVIKTGAELGAVSITIPFTLSPSGAGSAAAISQDPQSVRIAYYDEMVSPPVWKYDGCTGSAAITGALSAVFTANCSHLTSFGIIAAPPTAGPQTTSQPIPINPVPNRPGATAEASTPPSANNEFPLWAIILIPAVGGVALLSAGGFFAYRRVTAVRARAKQIVAASAWKTLCNVTTIPKPPSANSATTPIVSKVTDGRDIEKAPDLASLVSLSKSAEVSLPLISAEPSIASKISSVASRRQELANRAAASAELDIELVERDADLPQLTQLPSDVGRDNSLLSSTSPDRRNGDSSGNLQSSILSVLQRRQQHKNLISEAWLRAESPQVSPTRLPSRLPSPSPLSRSQAGQISPRVASLLANRSRSSSRSRGGAAVGSPFFLQNSQQSNQESSQSNESFVNTGRSPLPTSRSRARSVGRATSPLESSQMLTASSSASPNRFGSSRFDRPYSRRDQSVSPNYLANASLLSPTSASSFSPLSASASRSGSRPGFVLPLRSSQDGANIGSGTRYDQA